MILRFCDEGKCFQTRTFVAKQTFISNGFLPFKELIIFIERIWGAEKS